MHSDLNRWASSALKSSLIELRTGRGRGKRNQNRRQCCAGQLGRPAAGQSPTFRGSKRSASSQHCKRGLTTKPEGLNRHNGASVDATSTSLPVTRSLSLYIRCKTFKLAPSLALTFLSSHRLVIRKCILSSRFDHLLQEHTQPSARCNTTRGTRFSVPSPLCFNLDLETSSTWTQLSGWSFFTPFLKHRRFVFLFMGVRNMNRCAWSLHDGMCACQHP